MSRTPTTWPSTKPTRKRYVLTVYAPLYPSWRDYPSTATPVTSVWLSGVDDALTGGFSIALNGGGFANSYDTALWIAPERRTDPVINSQGLYVQHRVAGDLGGLVHDAAASELRLSGASNGGTGQNAHEASLVVTGGANTIDSANAILANFHTEGTPSGSFTSVALMRASTVPALTGAFTISTVYGLYLEQQTVGTANYSLYVAAGDSVLGSIVAKDSSSVALTVKGVSGQSSAASTFEVRTSGGTTAFRVIEGGAGGMGGTVGGNASFWVNNNNAGGTIIGVVIRGKSGASADLQQWQTGAVGNAVLANVDSSGAIRSTSALGTQHVGAATPTGGQSGDVLVGTGKLWANDAGTWKSVAIS